MKRITLILALVFLTINGASADRFVPKSDLIMKVLDIVSHLYVDQNRIQPVEMLEGSLERLSFKIAPVLTKMETSGGIVNVDVSVDQFRRAFSFKRPENVDELNQILQHIVRFVKQYLEESENPETVDYAVINGFLRQLDPHSSLLIPEIYEDFSTQTSGNFGGVGMMIGIRDGSLTIISPIENTPASRAGLKANDLIVQINEESTINMSLSDAVKKLRGKEGTEVDIYIMRKDFSSPQKFTIVRDIIEINSVKSFTFQKEDKRVGLIKINAFQQNTIDEINNQLDDLDYDLKDFHGLIIDLRNNPGGLLDQAIKVSDRFLSDGVIVSTAGLRRGSIRSYSAKWFQSITEVPIIVLINNGSASASEIVAAALKKNNRAVVLGIQTFGKGSVQQVIPFPGGAALRLTTSKYLTPGNISIQSVGVSPHIAINPYYISKELLHITKPKLDQGESSLDQNFSEWGDSSEPPLKSVYYLYENDEKPEDLEEEDFSVTELEKERLETDFLVQSAVNILVENQRKGFENLIQQSLSYLEKEQVAQEQKLINKFSNASPPIDWNSYDFEQTGEISTKIWIEQEIKEGENSRWERLSGPVNANSNIRLFLEAQNKGPGPISRLMAISESDNQLFDDRQFAFGMLKKGESKQWYVPIDIAESISSRNDLITFRFQSQNQTEIHTAEYVVKTKQKEPPLFQYSLTVLDDGQQGSAGNGDGKIDVGESITVKVEVTNKGDGESGSLTVLLKNGEGKNVFLNAGRQSLESLEPGAIETAYFQFDLKKKPADQNLDFSLDIIDSVFTLNSINQKLKLPIEKSIDPIINKPPVITLNNLELTSQRVAYDLEGIISDNKGVKDLYVFVNRKKVFYKNFQNAEDRSSVSFGLEVDLEEAINRLSIISRDFENVSSQKNVYVRNTAFK